MLPDQIQRFDANIQALNQIERSMALPALPNEVKLDLAMAQGMQPSLLSSLFAGIQNDSIQVSKQLPTRDLELWAPKLPGLTPAEQTARNVHALLNEQTYPFKVDGNAVQRWKQRAVDGGYLDLSPDQIRSGQWLPEYRSIAYEMTNDEMVAKFAGEKPGSVSLEKIAQIAEDWLSPRGLYRAAMELDLWWDFEKISDEFSTWADKVAAWRDDPWNGRKLLDMLSGPIDDILMPVLNLGLMFTGVGQVWVTGRALFGAGKITAAVVKGAQTGGRVRQAYRALLVAEDVGADIARFGKTFGGNEARKNLTQTLLQPRGTEVGLASGIEAIRASKAARLTDAAIEGWRQNSAVVLAKKANQQVIRAGISSNIQQMADDPGQYTIANMTTIDDYVNQALENPFLDVGIDMFLTPANYFQPGAFKKVWRLRHTEETWKKLDQLSQSADIVGALEDPTREYLRMMTERGLGDQLPISLSQFDELFKESPAQALAHAMGYEGRPTEFGGFLATLIRNTSIDAAARAAVERMGIAKLEAVPGVPMNGAFYQQMAAARQKIAAQVQQYNPYDVNRVLDQYHEFGGSRTVSEGPAVFEELVRWADEELAVQSGMARSLDEVGELVDSAGEVPAARRRALSQALRSDTFDQSEYVILTRHLDPDTGSGSWRISEVTDQAVEGAENVRFTVIDPVEYAEAFDLPSPQAARQHIADNLSNPDFEIEEAAEFLHRYTVTDADGVIRPPKLSDIGEFRPYDRDRLATMRQHVNHHNEMAAAFSADLISKMTPEALRAALFEILPSIGNGARYMEASTRLHNLVRAGKLDDVKIAPPVSQVTGRKLSTKRLGKDNKARNARRRSLRARDDVDPVAARDLDPASPRAWMTPFARDTKETWSNALTLRYVGDGIENATPVKSDYVEAIDRIVHHRTWLETWDTVVGKIDEAGGVLADGTKLADVEAGTYTVDDILRMMADMVPANQAGHLRRLAKQLVESGRPLSDGRMVLEHALRTALDDMDLPRLRVAYQATGDVMADAEKVRRALRSEANGAATRVDLPQDVADELAAMGYDVVVGENFSIPHELSYKGSFPEVEGVALKHLRKKTLSEFFHRKDPQVMAALKNRAMKSHLYAELSRVMGGRSVAVPQMGDTFDPSDPGLRKVLDDLWRILDEWQQAAATADPMTVLEKVGHRWQYAQMAGGIDNLPTAMGRKRFNKALLELGYTMPEINAIRRASLKARDLGWSEQGLLSAEFKLRSQPQVVQALRLLGRHESSNKLAGAAFGGSKAGGALVGGFVASADMAQRSEDSDITGRTIAAGLGAVTGAVAGGAVAKQAIKRIGNVDLAPKLTSRLGSFNPASLADRLENGSFAKWAYVADNLANMRDTFRFTLSPIFDASRYSEAFMLNLFEGKGQIRLNQAPSLYRRRLAKEFRKEGADAAQAKEQALRVWNEKVAQFRAASGGRDDWDVIDGLARRYESVGMLGFSPMAYQVSTFAQMMDAGADAKTAYETAKNIYTYGTTGRSAAELSANFIFFPISFTKKSLNHMRNFVKDDMGRAVLIHDMISSYQLLNETYDLDQEFKDRLPILNRASRLNMLAYGVGLGQFGGVNASLISGIGQIPGVRSAVFPNLGIDAYAGVDPSIDGITNLFIPQALSISSASHADDVLDVMKKLLPAINDIDYMISDALEQMEVFGNDSMMTNRAEQRRGWAEWREWQTEQMEALDRMGITWEQAMRQPEFAVAAREVRADIGLRNPNWKFSFGDGLKTQQILDAEVNERLRAWETGESNDPADRALAEFVVELDAAKHMLSEMGYSFSTPEDVPPAMFEHLHATAIRILNKQDSDYAKRRWLRLWGRTYERLIGPLTVELA